MSQTALPGRPVEFSQERKALSLAEYARSRSIAAAAEAGGVSLATLKRHRTSDESFGDAWALLKAHYVAELEAEADRRGRTEGTVKATYGKDGTLISEEVRYSDGLLTLLLKANAPEKYRENIAIGVSGGTTVDVSHRIDPATMSQEQRVAMRLLLRGTGKQVEVTIGEEATGDEG